ncbi:MAG TPA: hypothetical protein VKS78_08130 [Roseiarcus sp.]|nr:hypothetical protein [Roseiarcus sp.]
MINGAWLLFATTILSVYSVGQVWLVQLSSYRLWAFVGAGEFRAYHAAWWRSIWGVVLAPAALVTIGALLMLWRPSPGVPSWAIWLGVVLQAALVAGTAIWWGPLMARLEAPSGMLMDRYQLLMTTHWLRVALVTAYALLALWMLARSLGLGVD